MGAPDVPGLLRRLGRLLAGVPLPGEGEERYQVERLARNRRNVRATVLALAPAHLLAFALYWPPGGPLPHLPEFRATVCLANLLIVPLALGLAALVTWVEPRRWPGRWRGWGTDLFALIYVLFSTGLSINAQRVNGNINVFTLTMLALGLLLRQRAWATLLVMGTGLAALVGGIMWVQPVRDLQVMALSPAVAVTALAFVMARINVATARAELAARMLIERQGAELTQSHAELGALNQELEQRVRSQVDEIVARAREIEKLNQHLRAQVIDRSRQLAQALKSLGPRTQHTLEPGQTIDGRVEIRGRLGSGAMGDVYRGADRILERDVAVKVLRPDSGVSSDIWVRFAAEAEAAAAVHHPCVVHTLHVGVTEDGRLYQLQELIDGINLATTLVEGERWPALAAARIGARVADALAAAHAAGVVHRDVKPSNVMITTRAPGVHLLDFGVSKSREPGAAAAGATGRNDMVGTPIYMAPEQISAPETVAAPCDVYALGVLLHELVAGKPPFVGNAARLLEQHLTAPAPRLPEELAPPALSALIQRCLAKAPGARPTARELAAELGALADAAGIPAAELLERPRLPEGANAKVVATGETVRLQPGNVSR